jgi:hypothetical protein
LSDWRIKFWFPLGWFFESGSIGRVPNVFEIPFIFEATDTEHTTTETKVISTRHTEIDELTTDSPDDDEEEILEPLDKKTS